MLKLKNFLADDEAPEATETLVVINDNGTADIATVLDKDHEKVRASSYTSNYVIPLSDLKAFASPNGIIYTYPSTHENIEDCQRLADLEKSIVLRQITQYERPVVEEPDKIDFMKYFKYGIFALVVIILAVT